MRGIAKEPFLFTDFPENDICPVCNTNDQGRCVLVMISGTENLERGLAEATPIHLGCAIAERYMKSEGILFRRCKPKPEESHGNH